MTGRPVEENTAPGLKRELTLPLVTFYGLGVTIGAGIYVLVGLTAAKAGVYAPISFLFAAAVTAFTGLSYAELSTRMPVSAGEAAYVRAGFNSNTLALIVGLLVAASGLISAATVSIGAASYIQYFVNVNATLLTVLVIITLGLVALWGIFESVLIASIFTLIEIFGLALVIYFGLSSEVDFVGQLPNLIPPMEAAAWTGIFSATLLAFFAFVGFEDIANIAEEVKHPRRTMPLAIFFTLVLSTLIYFIVVSVIVLVVPMDKLINSSAPLALVFESSGKGAAGLFSAIAIVATLNGILIQMIMASRILYGLSSQKSLPEWIGEVHPFTRTPLNATLLVVVIVLTLALLIPIGQLAEYTSITVLLVFSLVNLALIKLKSDRRFDAADYFEIPDWVPYVGFISSVCLLLSGLL